MHHSVPIEGVVGPDRRELWVWSIASEDAIETRWQLAFDNKFLIIALIPDGLQQTLQERTGGFFGSYRHGTSPSGIIPALCATASLL
jgi:hypothetical protein